MRTERIWVRLYREATDTWLEAHVEVIAGHPRDRLLWVMDERCADQFPGWELVTYCVPEAQGPDGRPLEANEYD